MLLIFPPACSTTTFSHTSAEREQREPAPAHRRCFLTTHRSPCTPQMDTLTHMYSSKFTNLVAQLAHTYFWPPASIHNCNKQQQKNKQKKNNNS